MENKEKIGEKILTTKVWKKSLWTLMIAFIISVGVWMFTFSWKTVTAEDATAGASGYGFTSNSNVGSITETASGVQISGNSTGNIFDYTYDTPLNANDLNVIYQVVNDSTIGGGAHSRLNFYFLPSKTATLEEGIHLQILHLCYPSPNNVKEIRADITGVNQTAYFSSDNSVNLRLAKEGDWYLFVNGARLQFSNANDIEKLNGFSEVYLRITAHYQETGNSNLTMNLLFKSIDEVSLGTGIIPKGLFASKKLDTTANYAKKVTDEGLELSGQFNPGVATAFLYGGKSFEIEAGKLASYSMTIDASGVDYVDKKYFDISFTNITQNSDRMTAEDSYGDYSSQTGITAVTYRFYNGATSQATLIVKYNDGTQGTYYSYSGQNHLNNAPYYEFESYTPRTDKVVVFNLMNYEGTWKVFINGGCLGFDGSANAALDSLNAGTVAVSVGIGSVDAANYYKNNNKTVPTDKIVITGLNGAKIEETLLNIRMVDGAYLRVNSAETSGLAFETEFDKTEVDALYENVGEGKEYASVTFGTIIFPIDYLTEGVEPTLDSLTAAGHTNILNVVSTGFNDNRSTDTLYRYRASIVDLKDANYYRDFIGLGYVKAVDSEGTEIINYATYNVDNARSVYEVAKAAYQDRAAQSDTQYQNETKDGDFSPYEESALDIAKSYMDSVVIVSIDETNVTVAYAGETETCYTPPIYTLTYSEGKYTLTSTSTIKFLVVNESPIVFTVAEDGMSCVFTLA